MTKFKKERGGISIIGILLFGFVVILVLSYFKISVRSVVESPTGQDNISYVGGGTRSLWNDYLKEPASYLWNDIFIDIFWKSFINNMERIRDGEPTDYEMNAPVVNRQ
ncbi:MAG: hypothetical protein WC447_00710 [Candidatus Paceibacterota bacterium]|jgi:hypothetical protein